VSQPEDENQRPSKISRLESYNEQFRPSLAKRPQSHSIIHNEPGHGFNSLSLNMQPGEQGLDFLNNEADTVSIRNDSITMSSEGSTYGLLSQSPPSFESFDTAAIQSRASESRTRARSCCKRSRNQSPQSSPETLDDTANDANAFSSAVDMEFRPSTNRQSHQMESAAFFDDAKGQLASPFQAQFTFQAPQVPYTTIYNMPPTYATAANPLTLEQQAFMLQNSQFHSQDVPQYAPSGLIGLAAPSAEGDNALGLMHDCSCGPDCQCMFCAVHPYNAPTRDRVQILADLLPIDDMGHSSRSRPQSSYGSISHSPEDNGAGAGTYDPRLPEDSPVSSVMQSTALTQPDPSSNNLGAMPFGSLDQAQDSTARSSGYLTMAYSYGPEPQESCTSGNCRCGDNCVCVGCLTHTGHDGQVLQVD